MNAKRNWRDCSGIAGCCVGVLRLERDFRFDFDAPMRPPIGQPLAFDTLEGGNRPLGIRYAETGTMVVPEIELCGVAMQVRLAHVEVAAEDAALEDRKVVLDRVGMPEHGAHVF